MAQARLRPVALQLKRVMLRDAAQPFLHLRSIRHVSILAKVGALWRAPKEIAESEPSGPVAPLDKLRLAMRRPVQDTLPPLHNAELERALLIRSGPFPQESNRRIYSQVGPILNQLVSSDNASNRRRIVTNGWNS